jgi:hypothetical protein
VDAERASAGQPSIGPRGPAVDPRARPSGSRSHVRTDARCTADGPPAAEPAGAHRRPPHGLPERRRRGPNEEERELVAQQPMSGPSVHSGRRSRSGARMRRHGREASSSTTRGRRASRSARSASTATVSASRSAPSPGRGGGTARRAMRAGRPAWRARGPPGRAAARPVRPGGRGRVQAAGSAS